MSNVSKGSRWRRAVEVWLNEAGHITHSRPWMEPGDDITVYTSPLPLSVEAKDQRALALAAWVDQARKNAPRGAIPVVIAHRLGHTSPDMAYVIMSGSDFRRLIEHGE